MNWSSSSTSKPLTMFASGVAPPRYRPLSQSLHLVAAFGGDPRRLHAGRAAADYEDSLPRAERRHVVLVGAEAGVDAAVPRQVVVRVAGAAVRARLDVVQPALADLARVVRVGEEPPVDADQVRLALAQRLLAEVGVQHADRHDGDRDHLLDDRPRAAPARRRLCRLQSNSAGTRSAGRAAPGRRAPPGCTSPGACPSSGT